MKRSPDKQLESKPRGEAAHEDQPNTDRPISERTPTFAEELRTSPLLLEPIWTRGHKKKDS